MKKLLKILGLILSGKIILLVLITTLLVNCSPQFGGAISGKMKEEYAKSENYKDGKFVNSTPTEVGGFKWSVMREFFRKDSTRQPSKNIEVEKLAKNHFEQKNITRVTWFGHSAFLLELDGKNILIDPMLGKVAAPFEWAGTNRFNNEHPISIEDMPFIDAVLISHDHYDHLDYPSIEKLKEKVGAFYVPLGIGAHLKRWKIDESKINELNWWEETQLGTIQLAFTPSRHFSGRGLFDRYKTLWGSWVIKGESKNIYFSGDGGYGPHFKEIGGKYGPFDFAMIECGQYNENWSEIHMMPEQTVQASKDVKARLVMPIHWGGFRLALHSWTDPIERFTKKAKDQQVNYTTPKIGEVLQLDSFGNYPTSAWWEEY